MSIPEHFLGEIVMFGGNYPPSGWAFCDGSKLQISQNTALFSVISNRYGGDGNVDFALPDLKGRYPLHRGNQFTQGGMGGSYYQTLRLNQMPQHTHNLQASKKDGTTQVSTDNVLADSASLLGTNVYGVVSQPGALTAMSDASVRPAGDQQPKAIPTVPPYTAVNFIICLDGIYPSRT